jgi:hypothetical protein
MTTKKDQTEVDSAVEHKFAEMAILCRDWVLTQKFEPDEFPDPSVFMFDRTKNEFPFKMSEIKMPLELWEQGTAMEAIRQVARKHRSIAVAIYATLGDPTTKEEFFGASLHHFKSGGTGFLWPMNRVGNKIMFGEPIASTGRTVTVRQTHRARHEMASITVRPPDPHASFEVVR